MPERNKTDPKAVIRQERYEDKMRAKGFVRVHPWVHKNKRRLLLDYAEKLNSEYSLTKD